MANSIKNYIKEYIKKEDTFLKLKLIKRIVFIESNNSKLYCLVLSVA